MSTKGQKTVISGWTFETAKPALGLEIEESWSVRVCELDDWRLGQAKPVVFNRKNEKT